MEDAGEGDRKPVVCKHVIFPQQLAPCGFALVSQQKAIGKGIYMQTAGPSAVRIDCAIGPFMQGLPGEALEYSAGARESACVSIVKTCTWCDRICGRRVTKRLLVL